MWGSLPASARVSSRHAAFGVSGQATRNGGGSGRTIGAFPLVRASRSLAVGSRVAGDVPALRNSATSRTRNHSDNPASTTRADGGDPDLAPVEAAAVDEPAQRGERVRRRAARARSAAARRAARRPDRRPPTAASPRTSRPTPAPRRRCRTAARCRSRTARSPNRRCSSTAAIGTSPNPSVHTSNEKNTNAPIDHHADADRRA